ncbi:hypothetical protein [Methylophaga sp.]|uniref:hypothetical protein n=1 Tax=Methylophaga sp. TaxID=2024840 RepID=UPI003A911C7A
MVDSVVKVESLSLWDFDRDVLTDGLRSEGKLQAKDAKRLVARKAISKAGEYPGKRSGVLQRSIKTKMFRNGLGVYITHQMPRGQFRYPFVLVNGSSKNGIKARKDYIVDTFTSRRSAVLAMIQASLKKSIKADKVTL